MGQYVIRRILTAIPTLIFISFVIFALLDLAPGDPTSNLPQSIPQEVKERIREALGCQRPVLGALRQVGLPVHGDRADQRL